MAIPAILLAIALVALTRASVMTVIVAITIPEVPRVVRLVRSVVLTVREEPYVEAAIAGGTPVWKILLRHILPNTLPPLIVQATYICASAILIEAGAVLPRRRHAARDPDLGQHDRAERGCSCRGRRGRSSAPGIALALVVLAVNLARRRPARPARPAPREADVRQHDAAPPRGPRPRAPHFFTEDGDRRARSTACRSTSVAGETLGIVGESGCGKSVTALSIMRLLPPRLGRTVARQRRASRAATSSALDESEMRDDPRQPHRDDLPGADDRAQPGAHRRPPDRRVGAHPRGRLRRPRRGRAPSRC